VWPAGASDADSAEAEQFGFEAVVSGVLAARDDDECIASECVVDVFRLQPGWRHCDESETTICGQVPISRPDFRSAIAHRQPAKAADLGVVEGQMAASQRFRESVH
jgi:hypothetical protein